MDLDQFIVSILFGDKRTEESAKKIEGIVGGLRDKIIGAFTAIASIDFLKNALQSSINLATKLDNLTYTTNISKESLVSWGQAVQHTGGTTEGFYSSISSLSEKIRDMQTNFGSAGQLVFARLGINIADVNGHVKNAVQVLGELGDKFKNLPKVWQLNLGQQLGLDPATIRLISSGSEAAQKLVQNMAKYAQINALDTENNIKLRNSFYDLSIVFDSIKLRLVNALIPAVQKFSELLLKALTFLQEHSKAVNVVLLGLGTLMSGLLVSSIASVTRAFIALTVAMLRNPFVLITAAIIAFGLVVQDFIVYLRGGKSAFEEYYKAINQSAPVKTIKYITHALQDFADTLLSVNKAISNFTGWGQLGTGFDFVKEHVKNNLKEESIKDKIKKAALSVGINPDVAIAVAQAESGLNPDAKSSTSSASGLFQLTDATASSNGITDLSKKNNITENINAGISNLKKLTDGLTKFFNRSPTAGELHLGEMLGLAGSEKIFSSSKNTMLSTLLNESVLKANPQYRNMTSGQLINNANKQFNQKSVTVGEVNINAPNSNANEISKKIGGALQQHLSSFVTNIDNGVIA